MDIVLSNSSILLTFENPFDNTIINETKIVRCILRVNVLVKLQTNSHDCDISDIGITSISEVSRCAVKFIHLRLPFENPAERYNMNLQMHLYRP